MKRLRDCFEQADRATRAWWLGLVGVALLLAGSGWYQVWAVPVYRYTDEQAHAGYVLELQAGRLPEIDTPIDGAHGGWALETRTKVDPRHKDVWVANNPPAAYVLAMGPAALTRALGIAGGPLIGMRLTNLACFVLATVLLARMASRLCGGDRRIGLIAAGLFAAIPHVADIAGAAYCDGLAMLCSVAMLDVLVELLRRGPTRRQVVVLGLWAGVGAATRPMTATLAGAICAMALAAVAYRWFLARRRDEPTPVNPVFGALALGVPTLVLSGWWYLRSQRLYGDPTGSKRLFEKFNRVPRTNALDVVHFPSVWRENLRGLFTRRIENILDSDPASWWPPVKYGLPLFLIATVVVVAADQVVARRRGTTPRTAALSWAAAYVVILVTALLSAQHWAGGGEVHPRYLFPALVVFCAAIALPLVRAATPWAGVALMAVFVYLQRLTIPRANLYLHTARPTPIGTELTLPIGPAWWRFAGLAVLAVGFVAVVVALALGPARSDAPEDLAISEAGEDDDDAGATSADVAPAEA